MLQISLQNSGGKVVLSLDTNGSESTLVTYVNIEKKRFSKIVRFQIFH